MPLGPGVRYRVKTTKSGKKVRLAFKGKKVVEAKRLESSGEKKKATKRRKRRKARRE